jgi:hypothetical protein
MFAESHASRALGIYFYKKTKRKVFAESLARLPLSKEFFFKKGKLFAESEPDGLSAKKASVATSR